MLRVPCASVRGFWGVKVVNTLRLCFRCSTVPKTLKKQKNVLTKNINWDITISEMNHKISLPDDTGKISGIFSSSLTIFSKNAALSGYGCKKPVHRGRGLFVF